MVAGNETVFLLVIVAALLVSDVMALLLVNDQVAKTAIIAQITITTSAGLMLFMPQDSLPNEKERGPQADQSLQSSTSVVKQTQLRDRSKSVVPIRF